MSEKRDPSSPEDGLNLEWLDDWEVEPDTQVAKSRSSSPPPAPEPEPETDFEELDPDLDVFDMVDEEDADTRVAEIPPALMATLQELDGAARTRAPRRDTPFFGDADSSQDDEQTRPVLDDTQVDEDEDIYSEDEPTVTRVDTEPALELSRRISRAPTPEPILTPLPPLFSEPEIESAIDDVLREEPTTPVLGDDLADLAPPSTPPEQISPATDRPPRPTRTRRKPNRPLDKGARAAKRTVHRRKHRSEQMPLVGVGSAVDTARRELLYDLATASEGRARAGLFSLAGSLAEAHGDLLAAREAYEEARAADSQSAEPLRCLQRLGRVEGDWTSVVELLMAEASLDALPRAVRARAAQVAASTALQELQSPEQALAAARLACALEPASAYAASLVLRALGEHGPVLEIVAATLTLADRTEDSLLASSLRVDAGIRLERAGDPEGAREAFAAALEAAPDAPDALFALARVARKAGDLDTCQRSLARLASLPMGAGVKRALERERGRLLCELQRPLETQALLRDASDSVALRERVDWAEASGDPQPALKAWIANAEGTERALALVRLAEHLVTLGDIEQANACIHGAREADGTLGLARVVREVLARSTEGAESLMDTSPDGERTGEPAIAAAARAARAGGDLTEERRWLRKAVSEAGESAYTRIVSLDAAAQAQDAASLASALTRLREHPSRELAFAASLSLSEACTGADRKEAWVQALELAPHAAAAAPLRVLAVTAQGGDERAGFLQRELALARGPHAASLGLVRARLLMGEPRRDALQSALDGAPAYLPARLSLMAAVRARGELDTLKTLCLATADASDGAAAVGWLVRAALIAAEADSETAAKWLVRAARLAPNDAILQVLVTRVGDALPAGLRAELFEQSLQAGVQDPLTRARLLNAAGAREDAGDPSGALALYERALALRPGDPFASGAIDRLKLEDGMFDEVIDGARRQADAAETPLGRLRAHKTCMRLWASRGELNNAQVHARYGLSLAPRDPECLRMLERAVLAREDRSASAELQRELLEGSMGPVDRGARLRLMSVCVADSGSEHDEPLDASLCRSAENCAGSPWLARRLVTAGRRLADMRAVTSGWGLMLGHAVTAAERASVLARLAERPTSEDPTITDVLRGTLQATPEHGVGAEHLAMRLERERQFSDAAELLEHAAKVASSPQRQVRLWHRAAVLWQDQVAAPERAKDSLRAAASVDVAYEDVGARLESLLGGRQDVGGLIALTRTRISAGGAPHELVSLHRHLAELYEKQGNRSAARDSLKAALEVDDGNLEVLRSLADLLERDGQFHDCAEVWIGVARRLQDPEALANVFFKLGTLYEAHLPDEDRAAAAFRRVLKLRPRDVNAHRRLASLYEAQDRTDAAIEVLTRLLELEGDPEKRRDVALRLARRLEEVRRSPEAEQVLERVRRERNCDLPVLSALARVYRAQAATSALAMHINRAAGDLRHAISEHLDDAEAWSALTEVLGWRGATDHPSIVATTALSLGVEAEGVRAQASQAGAVVGTGQGALAQDVLDLLSPDGLSRVLRDVLAQSSAVFDKVMPFDPRTAEAEKLPRRHPLRATSRQVAQALGMSEATIWVSARVPHALFAVTDSRPDFVVGNALLTQLDPAEQRFALARAYVLAHAGMSAVCRVSPDDLAVLLHGFVRAFVEGHSVPGLDARAVEETAVRVQKALPRRLREQLHDQVVELSGASHFDPFGLYAACSRFASRVGLVATGELSAAFSALHKMSSNAGDDATPTAIRRTREARQLASFAVSELHFEARRKAGVHGS